MRGYNQIIIVGNLGADPDMRYTGEGMAVTTFNVACSRKYTAKNNEIKEETEWFKIVAWDTLGERCEQFLSKGDPALVVGRIHNKSWIGQDNQKHYGYEVIASNVTFLTTKKNGDVPDEVVAEPAPVAVAAVELEPVASSAGPSEACDQLPLAG